MVSFLELGEYQIMIMQAILNNEKLDDQRLIKRTAVNGIISRNVDSYYDRAVSDLFTFITELSGLPLTTGDKNEIERVIKIKTIRRKQFLLQEGDVCRYLSFVVKGALRVYCLNSKGQESIISFGTENTWVADRESLLMQKPSRFNIDAVEQTYVIQLNANQLESLSEVIPAVARMTEIHDKESAIATQRRIHSAISMTAEERYLDMLQTYPAYEQRFSQNMIAAFLGIKPETLSRIRKR